MTVWTTFVATLRSKHRNFVSLCLGQIGHHLVQVLVILFIGCILIKGYEDTARADPELALAVFGFSSTGHVVALLLVFIFGMLLLLLLSFCSVVLYLASTSLV